MKQIQRYRGEAGYWAECMTQPGVYAQAGKDEGGGHHQLQPLIQPHANSMRCGYQPVQSWAIMMEDGRAQSIVDGWKPARPEDALLKGALDGCAAVEMHLHVARVQGYPVDLPERTGDKNG